MEINLKTLSTQASESTTNSDVKMRLSENATSMVFQLFTKNIYSNPIGTVVREITSNCFDSHIEANIKAPVLIKKGFDDQTNSHFISFIDYGMGMSPDRVNNIYGVYFESTKRIDNTQIGGFGIGGKTPLAYKRSTGHGEGEYDNSFYVITIFDNIKYYYCIYEGQESPVISLLHQESTTEHNGTEVRVPVLDKDLYTFKNEMVKQLYYFEDIVFEGFEDEDSDSLLTNEYQIIRGKNFLFRGKDYSPYIHVCLGRVAYPINFDILGLNGIDYQLPVSIKLEINEIGVIASREALDYSENTIKVLKKKLEIVKAEITELLAKQYSDIVTLEQYFNVKNDFGKLFFSNGSSMYVGNLIKQKDVDFSNFRYNFMSMPNDKQLFKFFFNVSNYGKKVRTKRSRYGNNNDEFEGGYKEIMETKNLYCITGEYQPKRIKQGYLKAIHGLYHIVKKKNLAQNVFKIREDIADLFNVAIDNIIDDKGIPVDFVKSLINLQDEYFDVIAKHVTNYDDIEVPEDFIMERKHNIISKEMRNTSIPVRFALSNSIYRIKLDHLFRYNMPIFYGTSEDEYKLNNANRIFNALFGKEIYIHYYSEYDKKLKNYDDNIKKSIIFIRLAQNNIKYMKYCKKAYHINEFQHRMLYRKEQFVIDYFTSHNISDEKFNQLNSIFKDKDFGKINTKLGKKIVEVSEFFENYVKTKNLGIECIKEELFKYFNIPNVQQTGEQKRIEKLIDELLVLQSKNEGILRYIDLPYSLGRADKELFNILKKVMVF